jgi:hypothetical protein
MTTGVATFSMLVTALSELTVIKCLLEAYIICFGSGEEEVRVVGYTLKAVSFHTGSCIEQSRRLFDVEYKGWSEKELYSLICRNAELNIAL